ncbi:MAG: hypothetical protein SNJ70_03755 [Armatimonadota bacterium]
MEKETIFPRKRKYGLIITAILFIISLIVIYYEQTNLGAENKKYYESEVTKESVDIF